MKKNSPEIDEAATLMADYFYTHIDLEYLIKWVAISNSLHAEVPRSEDTCDMDEFLYQLGSKFLPGMIGVKTQKELHAAIKRQWLVMLRCFPGTMLRECLAQLGSVYLIHYAKHPSSPETMQLYMETLVAFMAISEILEDYSGFFTDVDLQAA